MKKIFIKKIKIWIILITIIFVVIFYLIVLNWNIFINYQQNISLIADIFTSLAFLGVILAYVDYKQKQHFFKKQVLLALKSQLEVIGIWSGYGGNGYNALEKEGVINGQKIAWSNPFHLIFSTESTALQNILSLPGITSLDNEIVEKISPLNQEIENFNSYLNQINTFVRSIPYDVAISIDYKLKKYTDPFSDITLLTDSEKGLCKKILDMYIVLHFQIIGDDSTGRLYKRLKDLLNIVKNDSILK